MDENDRRDASIATDVSTHWLRRSLPLLAGLMLFALILFMWVLFRDRLLSLWLAEDDLGNRFQSGALLDYVPADSEAVLTVNVRSLLESPVGRRLESTLRQMIQRAERRLPWIKLLGVDPIVDLDCLQISFAPAIGSEPLWLAHGRLDGSRIQMGPEKLQEKTVEHFRVWEYVERRMKRTTWIAPAGDMLVVSETPGSVLAALNQASAPRPITVRDTTLRELLTQVDRHQSLWLAASIQRLSSIKEIEEPVLKMVLRPILANATSVYGGLVSADDVQVELHFHAATTERAERLEADLQSICEAAPGAALLLGRQKELLPLLRLLGSGKTHREGNEVRFLCRLAADQLEE